MRTTLALVVLAVGIVAPARAADHPVLGRSFVVTDGDPGGDPSGRKISVSARQPNGPALVGDPLTNGATIEVIANGTRSTSQVFAIPPGPAPRGGAGWVASGSPVTAWTYRDRSGVNGPAHAAVLKRTSRGDFTVRVSILGRQGPGPQPRVRVVPPAPGTDGGIVLTIVGGDSYCVAFGGAAGGSVSNLPTTGAAPGTRTFRVTRPTSTPGCPVPATTTSTVTTTSTTSSTISPSCGNGVLDPGEECDPPGDIQCPAGSPAAAFLACGADCTCRSTTTTTSTSSSTSTSVAHATTSTSTSMPTTTSRTSTSVAPTSTTSTSVAPTSTSTTTPASTTTSTTLGGGTCPSRLTFTTTAGTTSCGGASLSPAPAAPASGAIFTAASGGTKIADLGLSCLYVGGGGNTATAPNANPDGAPSVFTVASCSGSQLNLAGNAGTGPTDCTLGPLATKHCTRTPATPCTSDVDCGGGTGLCNPDARCFFGPPLPVPNGPTSTCILNVFAADGGGTVDQTAGSSAVSVPLSSRVYLTGNTKVCGNGNAGTDGFGTCTSDTNCGGATGSCQASTACPRCVANTCIGGQRHGLPGCTPVGSKATSLDCPPRDTQFIAPLGVTLAPLGTGTSTLAADANGKFCGASQRTAGAFGKTTARRIEETGSPAGSLTDHGPHAVTVAATFCIPATNNALIDGGTGADLPGPGAVSIRGVFQTTP